MNIIVHCSKISYDVDDVDLKTVSKLKKLDIKMPYEDVCGCDDEDTAAKIQDAIADEISNKTGFLVNGCSFTWEFDPADLIKELKKHGKKLLKKWKAAHDTCKRDAKNPHANGTYVTWMHENIDALGLTRVVNNFTGDPISVYAELTP